MACACASALLAITATVAFADPPVPVTIEVFNDANQDPVLTTVDDPSLVDPAQWVEYLWPPRGFPVVGGYSTNTSLPVMHISAPVADGVYDVVANLYGQPANTFRYYYSFSPSDPRARSVLVGPQSDMAEYDLGRVNVRDGTFDLYFNRADVIVGPQNYWGWSHVRLVPYTPPPLVSTPATSPWSLALGAAFGVAVVAAFSMRSRKATGP